jgi:hypothetical protein
LLKVEKSLVNGSNVHPNMGMAKAFGLFPTIYQEYSKKQVDSKYFIFTCFTYSKD